MATEVADVLQRFSSYYEAKIEELHRSGKNASAIQELEHTYAEIMAQATLLVDFEAKIESSGGNKEQHGMSKGDIEAWCTKNASTPPTESGLENQSDDACTEVGDDRTDTLSLGNSFDIVSQGNDDDSDDGMTWPDTASQAPTMASRTTGFSQAATLGGDTPAQNYRLNSADQYNASSVNIGRFSGATMPGHTNFGRVLSQAMGTGYSTGDSISILTDGTIMRNGVAITAEQLMGSGQPPLSAEEAVKTIRAGKYEVDRRLGSFGVRRGLDGKLNLYDQSKKFLMTLEPAYTGGPIAINNYTFTIRGRMVSASHPSGATSNMTGDGFSTFSC